MGRFLSLLLALLAAGQVMAATEIAGLWRGTLQVDPKTALTIDFTFTRKPDGTYSAVLNSPTSGAIKNVTAKAVSLQGDAVKVEVPALSGSFSGTLQAGSIAGKWAQPGGSFPLVLSPYQVRQMSKADIDTIVGTWSGPLRQAVPVTFVLRFRLGEQGDLQGSLIVPEQDNTEYPIAEGEFGNGKLAFTLPVLQGEFAASYVDGVLEGRWKQPGRSPNGIPVTLKKGEVSSSVHVLRFRGETFAPLLGEWYGTLTVKSAQGGEISRPLVMRFATGARAEMTGLLDSPAVGLKDVPVTDVSLDGDRFVAKLSTMNAEFRGELSGNTLKGEWVQGPQRVPLTFSRNVF